MYIYMFGLKYLEISIPSYGQEFSLQPNRALPRIQEEQVPGVSFFAASHPLGRAALPYTDETSSASPFSGLCSDLKSYPLAMTNIAIENAISGEFSQ